MVWGAMAGDREKKKQSLERLRECARNVSDYIPRELSQMDNSRLKMLIQTLQAYQQELEMQNGELQQTYLTLEETRNEYIDLYENSPVGYLSLDVTGRIIKANKTILQLLGQEKSTVIGRHFFSFLPEVDKNHFISRYKAFYKKPYGKTIELQLGHRKNCFISVTGRKPEYRSEYYEPPYILVAVTDISARKKSEKALNVAESVFNNTSEGIIVTNSDGHIIRVNKAFTRLTGYQAQEVLGRSPAILTSGQQDKAFYAEMWQTLHKHGCWQGEIWNRKKNGNLFAQWLSINSVTDGDGHLQNYIGVFNDITEKKLSEKHILQMAHYDSLTQLPNRALYYDRLAQALTRAKRNTTSLAVLFLDLNNFKAVNDIFGHDTGDLLLQQVAQRLSSTIRSSDTLSRLGGDEFIFLLEGIKDTAGAVKEASSVAEKILQRLAEPFEICGHSINTGASIGISTCADKVEGVNALIKQADLAMYQAKKIGKSNYCFFSNKSLQEHSQEIRLKQDLKVSTDNVDFVLHYQPKFALSSKKIIGFEALIRWIHPQQGILYPEKFINLAEESGRLQQIGDWVLHEACQQLSQWRKMGNPELTIAVNLSAQQIKDPNIIKRINKYLSLYGLPTEALEIEVTETVMIHDTEYVSGVLNRMFELGIAVSLDDFGVGYSSLMHIKRFPIQLIKIDKSFIQGMLTSTNDEAIVNACITLAKSTGLKVVAEGVETTQQLERLESAGCDFVQGFLISKPVPAKAASALLN